MAIQRSQDLTKPQNAIAVQFEFRNGGSAGRRQANHSRKPSIPGEVVGPAIAARVVERNERAIFGVFGNRRDEFVVVAAEA